MLLLAKTPTILAEKKIALLKHASFEVQLYFDTVKMKCKTC